MMNDDIEMKMKEVEREIIRRTEWNRQIVRMVEYT
jgi:hypothetical protein